MYPTALERLVKFQVIMPFLYGKISSQLTVNNVCYFSVTPVYLDTPLEPSIQLTHVGDALARFFWETLIWPCKLICPLADHTSQTSVVLYIYKSRKVAYNACFMGSLTG